MLTRRAEGEAGFTLVEVIVALSIFSVAATAIVPLLLTAAKAGQGARMNTQAKNLAQQRIEQMRNLPFHVDAKNGPYVDVLDQYYRNLTAASGNTIATATSGYVAASSTARVPGEPAGPFYRYVVPSDGSEATSGFRQIVASQFLSPNRQAVTPPSAAGLAYDSQATDGRDLPPSQMLGVTVLTGWTKFGVSRQFRLYTEIADAHPAAPLVSSQARASALRVTSTVDAIQATNETGIVNAQGALTTGSTASFIAQGGLLFLAPGDQVKGAEVVMAAPPNASTGTVSAGPQYLAGDCTLACVGKSSVTNSAVSVDNGLPTVGSAASPVTAAVVKENVGIRFSNKPDNPKLGFLEDVPLMDVVSSTGTVLARGSAYLATTAGPGHAATAGTGAATQLVQLFQTTWTPAGRGVVEVQLNAASLTCAASATGQTATADFSATIRYWDWDLQDYVTLAEVRDGGTDVLAGVDPTTVKVGPDAVLADYVAGWSHLTQADSTVDGKSVSATLDGIVSITTTPTRDGDPTSAVSVKVGNLSCYAEDNRP